jgi:hypothetical protein
MLRNISPTASVTGIKTGTSLVFSTGTGTSLVLSIIVVWG